jgi:hypothetical protein
VGCWNGTCGISNLPIHAGDEVVALLIEVLKQEPEDQMEGQSGTCYASDFAFPITAPFEAIYNDYGGLEEIKETALTDLIKTRFEAECLETFINDVVERDECIKANGNAVGLWMVHRSIWNTLTKSGFKSGWGDEDLYNEALVDFPKWYESLQNALKDNERTWFWEIGSNREHPFTNCISPDFSDGIYIKNALRPVMDLMKSYAKEGLSHDDPKVQVLVQPLVELRVMRATMGSLRKIWFPQSGKGAQNSSYGWHKALWDASKAVVDQRSAHNKEYNDAEEDYNIYDDWE